MIFELVQNFHNTATAADARVCRVRGRVRRTARKRNEWFGGKRRTGESEGTQEKRRKAAREREREKASHREGGERGGMKSPTASDGFELGKVQAAQKRQPPTVAPAPLSFRLAAPLRDSPLAHSPLSGPLAGFPLRPRHPSFPLLPEPSSSSSTASLAVRFTLGDSPFFNAPSL